MINVTSHVPSETTEQQMTQKGLMGVLLIVQDTLYTSDRIGSRSICFYLYWNIELDSFDEYATLLSENIIRPVYLDIGKWPEAIQYLSMPSTSIVPLAWKTQFAMLKILNFLRHYHLNRLNRRLIVCTESVPFHSLLRNSSVRGESEGSIGKQVVYTYSKVKLISPCNLAFNSTSTSRFNPICNLTGLISSNLGSGGAAVLANALLFLFLFLFRRRRLKDDALEPASDAMSEASASWRRSSAMISSLEALSPGRGGRA